MPRDQPLATPATPLTATDYTRLPEVYRAPTREENDLAAQLWHGVMRWGQNEGINLNDHSPIYLRSLILRAEFQSVLAPDEARFLRWVQANDLAPHRGHQPRPEPRIQVLFRNRPLDMKISGE